MLLKVVFVVRREIKTKKTKKKRGNPFFFENTFRKSIAKGEVIKKKN